jgi:hypothetical protein
METLDATLAWLMAGDPAIRWQTMRDLLDEAPAAWQAEQQRTLTEGWGSRLLACQNPDGGWGRGVYSPKWTSTTYTLLTLQNMGIPRSCAAAQRGTQLMLRQMLGENCDEVFEKRLAACDRCVVGMLLLLAVYFESDAARIHAMLQNLLDERMPDGAWNCRRNRQPHPRHSSFHSTISILEGLHAALEQGGHSALAPALRATEQDALELLLQHRLFRSDTTGAVIREEFTQLFYPHRWHYNVLRALALFACAGAPRDPRLQEAIDLLRARRRPDGRWHNQKKFSGLSFFELEKGREPSRMLTLQALRVLRWWDPENFGKMGESV